ncbi:Ldh family oxidoreductase [bacterium]|nr:Ldh family oxidoreductase [bacterium]
MKIEAGVLQDFVGSIFAGAGCSAEESARVSKYLVSANLVGHDSHGVVRVPLKIDPTGPGTSTTRVNGASFSFTAPPRSS